ncbi:hypothetical protein HN604_01810 [archaeon]|nr:hypothetical protein [archaeon]MBT6182745.1 hypothetical protein [archaeon]MBT6606552.1 hypothetical protein [archaeon]MBT7251821.1 hypothetical protein [archaeon]MBT7660797.1 hypothetical protein [archaeon]
MTYELDSFSTKVTADITQPETLILPTIYTNLNPSSGYELIEDVMVLEEQLIVSFETSEYIESIGKDEYLFTITRPLTASSKIEVVLPKGYILSNDLAFPKEFVTSSNGQNIILTWNDFDGSEIIIFYEKGTNTPIALYLITIIAIILGGIALAWYQNKNYKKRMKEMNEEQTSKQKKLKETHKKLSTESKTKNLFGDEKKIIEHLLKKKSGESWTKEMEQTLEISKVRLSRKLRSLEEKGLITKESHGNANLVRLVK